MIKLELTFVSGVQESVLVDFISQHKIKILHNTCQNLSKLSSSKIFLQNEQIYNFFKIFFSNFELLLLDFKLLK